MEFTELASRADFDFGMTARDAYGQWEMAMEDGPEAARGLPLETLLLAYVYAQPATDGTPGWSGDWKGVFNTILEKHATEHDLGLEEPAS